MNAEKLKKFLLDEKARLTFQVWLTNDGYFRDGAIHSGEYGIHNLKEIDEAYTALDFEKVAEWRDMDGNFEVTDYFWVIRIESDFIKIKAYYDSYDGYDFWKFQERIKDTKKITKTIEVWE